MPFYIYVKYIQWFFWTESPNQIEVQPKNKAFFFCFLFMSKPLAEKEGLQLLPDQTHSTASFDAEMTDLKMARLTPSLFTNLLKNLRSLSDPRKP